MWFTGLPAPVNPSPKFHVQVIAPGALGMEVFTNVTVVLGHIVLSLVVNDTTGAGFTVIVIVFTLLLPPLYAVSRTVYVPGVR